MSVDAAQGRDVGDSRIFEIEIVDVAQGLDVGDTRGLEIEDVDVAQVVCIFMIVGQNHKNTYYCPRSRRW